MHVEDDANLLFAKNDAIIQFFAYRQINTPSSANMRSWSRVYHYLFQRINIRIFQLYHTTKGWDFPYPDSDVPRMLSMSGSFEKLFTEKRFLWTNRGFLPKFLICLKFFAHLSFKCLHIVVDEQYFSYNLKQFLLLRYIQNSLVITLRNSNRYPISIGTILFTKSLRFHCVKSVKFYF